MTDNPFEPFLQYGENVKEMTESYMALVARNSPTPLYLSLPEREQALAKSIAESSDIRTYTDALNFGMEAQEKVKAFSNLLFTNMKKADTEKINSILHSLVQQLQQIDPNRLKPIENGFFKRLFKKSTTTIQQTVSNYKRLSKHVDRLAIELEHAKQDLQREHDRLNTIYEKNKQHFMHLNVFIAAIELKLQQLQEVALPQLQEEVSLQDDMFGKMSVSDLEQAIEWLDRRKYDLEISREITLQAAPQIRMTQATNQMLIEKIQGSVLATIPMWQTQIATILSLGHQTRIQQTQKRIDSLSEQMLDTNVQAAHFVSQEEQIDHLKETQQSLVETILQVVADKVDERDLPPVQTENSVTRTKRYNSK